MTLGSTLCTVCTEPFPKVVSPTITANPRSCRAPATISAALAVFPFTKTTVGQRTLKGVVRERYSCRFAPAFLPSVATTSVPPGTKRLTTSTAASTNPPGLSRKSRIRAVAPSFSNFPIAASNSLPVFSPNWVIRTYPIFSPCESAAEIIFVS